MAYKDMNIWLYLSVTLLLYAIEMTMAILIDDITTVFNFASAFSISFLAFWFPAGYYLLAEKRYGKDQQTWHHNASIIFLLLGGINCFIGLAAAVLSIIK